MVRSSSDLEDQLYVFHLRVIALRLATVPPRSCQSILATSAVLINESQHINTSKLRLLYANAKLS